MENPNELFGQPNVSDFSVVLFCFARRWKTTALNL